MNSELYVKKQIGQILHELKSQPENHSLLNDLGVGYFLIGEYRKAKDPLTDAIKFQPDNATYYYNLANVYSELKEYPKAINFYLDALEIDPEHLPSLTNLADCYESSGEFERAEQLFEYITKLAPENALSFFNFGNFHLRQNDLLKAVRNYKKAIELEDSFVDAYYNIAWILTEIKAYKEAYSYANRGLEKDPEHRDLIGLIRKIRNHIG